MIEAHPLATDLKQPIEAYFVSRKLPKDALERSLAELEGLSDEGVFLPDDEMVDFALSMIHLRLLEESIPPAVLLSEIVDIVQFGREYFEDERTLSELVAMVRSYLM